MRVWKEVISVFIKSKVVITKTKLNIVCISESVCMWIFPYSWFLAGELGKAESFVGKNI